MSHIILRVAVFRWWAVGLVKCLAKFVAFFFLSQKLLIEKVIEWIGEAPKDSP